MGRPNTTRTDGNGNATTARFESHARTDYGGGPEGIRGSGFAGARTDAIARRARINERMIFYCFDSKEGLYRAVLAQRLSAKAGIIESMPDEDFTSSLVKGFAANCADVDALRMWQWEALDTSNRKLVAEKERRAYFQAEVARWRRAKASGTLPPDADEEMLLLVSAALRAFPLALPQVTSLVTGMDPLDPEFRRKWSACLEWMARGSSRQPHERRQARARKGRRVGREKVERGAKRASRLPMGIRGRKNDGPPRTPAVDHEHWALSG